MFKKLVLNLFVKCRKIW